MWLKSNTGESRASSSNNQNPKIWISLWKINSQPKHLNLCWCILKGEIPVKSKNIGSGVNYESMCPRCEQFEENVDHAFRDCILASQIWCVSSLGFRFESQNSRSVMEWLESVLLEAPSQIKEMVASILYSIWWARNVKVYEF